MMGAVSGTGGRIGAGVVVGVVVELAALPRLLRFDGALD